MPLLLLSLSILFCLGSPSASAAEAAPKEIRLATYNLFHPPWHRAARLEGAARTLAEMKPDIVFLQEVAKDGILSGDPVALIGDRLGLPYRIYFPFEELLFYHQGVALLSRYPILRSENRKFSNNTWYEKKGFIVADLAAPGGTLHVINVHLINQELATQEPKASQLREIAATIAEKRKDGPVIFGGDFNSETGEPGFAAFLKSIQAKSLYSDVPLGATKKSWENRELLDYFFWIPAANDRTPEGSRRFTGGGIVVPKVEPDPSDHYPVWATIPILTGG